MSTAPPSKSLLFTFTGTVCVSWRKEPEDSKMLQWASMRTSSRHIFTMSSEWDGFLGVVVGAGERSDRDPKSAADEAEGLALQLSAAEAGDRWPPDDCRSPSALLPVGKFEETTRKELHISKLLRSWHESCTVFLPITLYWSVRIKLSSSSGRAGSRVDSWRTRMHTFLFFVS